MNKHELNELGTKVLDAAFEVHRALGPGLLENAYEMAMCHELACGGLKFERQKELPVIYKGVRLDCGYRLDIVVEDTIILELKSCAELLPVHEAMTLNYLMLSDLHLGYLINFNVRLLKNGIKRTIRNLPEC